MRQPAIPAALKALIAAVPAEALRELVLELLQNGAAEPAPAAVDPPRRATKRRGRPKGTGGRRGPGRPPKASAPAETAAARRKRNEWRRKHYAELQQAKRAKQAKLAERAAAKAAKAGRGAVDPKLLARRQRAVVYQRKKRAAAKLALAGGGRGPNPDGNGTKGPGAKPEITPAQLWAHAEAMQPLAPWRAVARELDLNTAQMQACYRHRSMPPALTSSMVEKFLELPAA